MSRPTARCRCRRYYLNQTSAYLLQASRASLQWASWPGQALTGACDPCTCTLPPWQPCASASPALGPSSRLQGGCDYEVGSVYLCERRRRVRLALSIRPGGNSARRASACAGLAAVAAS